MATVDLVFEGGGAKGIVFVGALEALLGTPERPGGFEPGRLLGTSAGAITATFLAARYSVPEMLAALAETDASGRHVFESFLSVPEHFEEETIQHSVIRNVLAHTDIPFLPDFLENKVEDWLARAMASQPYFCHLFSFVERGGWYSADAFMAWLRRKLDEGVMDGQPRRLSHLTMKQLHEVTGSALSLIAADTTAERMLILNHNTAPDLPVVWGVRMSMALPLVWQEVVWREEWGSYSLYPAEETIAGNAIVDGGMLSNFPIALFLAPDASVQRVMGETETKNVLGLLIDERLAVPDAPERANSSAGLDIRELRTTRRIGRMIDTMTSAHDNVAIKTFKENVVRLPAKGYGTTEFDMGNERRAALIAAGRAAMQSFLDARPPSFDMLGGGNELAADPATRNMASDVAQEILGQ